MTENFRGVQFFADRQLFPFQSCLFCWFKFHGKSIIHEIVKIGSPKKFPIVWHISAFWNTIEIALSWLANNCWDTIRFECTNGNLIRYTNLHKLPTRWYAICPHILSGAFNWLCDLMMMSNWLTPLYGCEVWWVHVHFPNQWSTYLSDFTAFTCSIGLISLQLMCY